MTKKSELIQHPGASIDLSDVLRRRFEEEAQAESFEEWLAKNTGSDEPGTTYALEFQENDEGEVCIKIPDELIILLGWELDDDIVFEEVGIEGEFTLQNISKQFREATQAWKDATSTDME